MTARQLYNDPWLAELARSAETMHGLPQGILDAIRTRGERSNSDQVSPAGARSVYQFIPSTRRAFIDKYNVDPWRDSESATQAAALHLKESYGRTNNWDAAVAGYHGGVGAEQGRRGPVNRAYTARVGSFENGGGEAVSPPTIEIPDSFDPNYRSPLAPERPKTTAPVLPGPGPSVPVAAASQAASQKRGGIIGSIGRALGSVFMPEPDSLYAAALRGGIWDAKANQRKYKQEAAAADTNNAMANAKLKNMLTKGEYQIAGNNVIHFPPDGGAPQVITPPRTPGEKESLIQRWETLQDGDPAKQLIERMLLGGNSDAVLQNRENVARVRGEATLGAAKVRGSGKGSGTTKYEYREVNGKLQRRRIN